MHFLGELSLKVGKLEDKNAMAWTDEMVAELARLWEQGLSTGEIGKQLGVSKNAVVGKAHRLGLTGRPSPIKRTASKQKTEKQASLVDLGPSCCRWPIGDPRDPGFHFCGKKALPGKPYCPEHASVAYVNTSKKSEPSSE